MSQRGIEWRLKQAPAVASELLLPKMSSSQAPTGLIFGRLIIADVVQLSTRVMLLGIGNVRSTHLPPF